MSWKTIARFWNEFFFQPQSPVPISIFRILISLIVLVDLALLRSDWLTWFGPRGLVPLAASQQVEQGPRLNVFAFLPQTEFWSNAIFYALAISAMFLCIGLFTRASSIAVFVLIASLHQRNLFITNSGDTLLRCSLFFLMFAPAGAALSLDRLRHIWSGKEGPQIRPRAPWAQRMIQIELSLLYFMTFWTKSTGPAWVDGTALYYVNHLDEFRRFPMPDFLYSLGLVRLETWFTLAAEFALGVLIWIRELRYPILIMGVLLHLSLEYNLNVPMFQWTTLALYVTFVDADILERAWLRIFGREASPCRRSVVVSYQPDVLTSRRSAAVLQALDIFGRLHLVNRKDPEAGAAFPVQGISSITRIAPRLWIAGKGSQTVAATVNT
jgi:hypothetical protein